MANGYVNIPMGGSGGSGGGGGTIGEPVDGGTANRILFIDSSGNLADSANLQFSGTYFSTGTGVVIGVAAGTPNYELDIRGVAGNATIQLSNTASGNASTDGVKIDFTGTNLTIFNQEVSGKNILSIAGSANTSSIEMDTATGDPSDGAVNYPRLRSATQFLRIGANAKDFFRMNGGSTGTGSFGFANIYSDMNFPNSTVLGALDTGADYQAGTANVGVFGGGLIAGKDISGDTNRYLSTNTLFSVRRPNPSAVSDLWMDIDNQSVPSTSFQIGLDSNLDAWIKSRKTGRTLYLDADGPIEASGDLLNVAAPSTATLTVTSADATYAYLGLFNDSGANAAELTLQGTGELDLLNSTTAKPIRLQTTDAGIEIGTGGTKPAAAAGNRGQLFFEPGGTGVADVIYMCMKSAADTYAWEIVKSAP